MLVKTHCVFFSFCYERSGILVPLLHREHPCSLGTERAAEGRGTACQQALLQISTSRALLCCVCENPSPQPPVRPSAKPCTCVNLFNPDNHAMCKVPLSSLFYRWGNRGSDELFAELIQPISGGANSQIQAIELQSLTLIHHAILLREHIKHKTRD